jgi:hypothetical protein
MSANLGRCRKINSAKKTMPQKPWQRPAIALAASLYLEFGFCPQA